MTADNNSKSSDRQWWIERSIDVLCVALWIFLSAAMVFYNKFLLSYYGFHFPIALTLWHMMVCSFLAAACIHLKLVQPLAIDFELYYSKVFPISACFAGALWTSNAAYSISSVSFVQMVKAGMPVSVYIAGYMFGVENFTVTLFLDILLITVGVGISAYGETHLVMEGLLLLLVSMSFEAVRLILTQQMIQSSGLKFNPITTLYYIAPVATCFLAIPFIFLEFKGAAHFVATSQGLWHFILNAVTAFGLNLSVYLLIGRTSALTMNVCGLVKDWFTISGSVIVFGSVVTVTNIVGYVIAFVGVGWYNYLRMPRAAPQEASKALEEAVVLDQEMAHAEMMEHKQENGHQKLGQQQQQQQQQGQQEGAGTVLAEMKPLLPRP